MINLYNMLPVIDGAISFEFINSDWLVKWLTTEEFKPIDNTNIICQHGKLDPCYVSQTKCISSSAVSIFLNLFIVCNLVCVNDSRQNILIHR